MRHDCAGEDVRFIMNARARIIFNIVPAHLPAAEPGQELRPPPDVPRRFRRSVLRLHDVGDRVSVDRVGVEGAVPPVEHGLDKHGRG